MAHTVKEALDYHRQGRPGKIEVRATKPLATQHHLSLAYSPGVAEAVLAVDKNPAAAFELTARGNLVAVVSNGSAILGLGDSGPLAAKPVMEGKGVLFKRFADIDVFDIEIQADTVEEMVTVVKALEPTFGGINLEDIKAPEAFEVERILKAEMAIPVFHDDQHGTAIISGAALLNACELTGRTLDSLRVVISGAGASAIATARFYVSLGVPRENIIMTDSSGIIYEGRERGNEYKAEFATLTDIRSIEEALQGADMLLGLSVAGAIEPAWLAGMNADPLLFMLANPNPEIMPEVALEHRPDAIIATGRSDYNNQVNNVLGFPFIFRGALDTRATGVNEEMKIAAAHALAELAREDVPDSVLRAYGQTRISYGRDYLIPKPLDARVLLWVAPAVAAAALESGVAQTTLDLEAYRESLVARQGRGQQFRLEVINRSRRDDRKRVVFAEGEHTAILRAAVQLEAIAEPILLGNAKRINKLIRELGMDFHPTILEPVEHRDDYAEALYILRQRRGVTRGSAMGLLRNPHVFGAMMLHHGDADVFISGLTVEYPEVLRPALQIIGT
ncbi:MAG: phosphate acyltransferase, partial [Anaerolineae bacterium]